MKKEPRGSFFYSREAGFTLAELVAVLVIVGVLAVVALPRFRGTGATFDEGRFYDQSLAALRFAQNAAVSMQRTVCVTFAAKQLTLNYRSAYGSGACDTNLPPPAGTGPTGIYTVVAQGSAGFSPVPAAFDFDRVGRPVSNTTKTLSLIGGRQIVVESETGYVR